MGKPLKVLVIRFSSIGDIVLTTPVIRGLKQQLNAEVHYLTKANYAGILKSNPYIHKVHVIKKEVKEVADLLKDEGFDYLIDLHKNIRSWQLKRLLNKPTFSFDKLNWQKWLVVNFKVNKLPDLHIVDRYLDTVKSLGVVNDKAGLDYFIPDKDEVDVPAFLNLLEVPGKATILPGQPYVALVIGAAHATKRMPTDRLIALTQSLTMPVLCLGGPDDRVAGERIEQLGGTNVFNLCGQLNLNQSASVVRQSSIVITHDTGLMHIAAAFQKRIITIWGNTVPAFGMYPYLPGEEGAYFAVEVDDLQCRPCSKIGYAKCPKGHFNCMRQIDLPKITDQVALWSQYDG